MRLFTLCCLLLSTLASAWAPRKVPLALSKESTSSSLNLPKTSLMANLEEAPSFDPFNLASQQHQPEQQDPIHIGTTAAASTVLAIATLASNPESAVAAVAGAPNAFGSALASYGHIFSVMAIVACIVYERATIKPGMSPEDEDKVAIADTLLGLWGVTLVYSGYVRITTYEKGWDFYQHEPVFWLKILFVSVFGACSFFNTTKIIQRSVAKRTGGTVPPMSEPLAARMNQICNAEITALAIIPLTASLMARGVGYMENFPWPVGAGLSAVVLFGLGAKYIKEALDFDDAPGAPVAAVVEGDSEN